jgi:hypothetical protein
MKLLHAAEITVFVKNSENIEADVLAEAFQDEINEFLAEKLEELRKKGFKTWVEEVEAKESYLEPMYITHAKLEKKPELLLDAFVEKLSEEDKKFLKESVETRVDDNGDFFMRFDADLFINKRKLKLVDHGDCLHLKCKVAAYPQNKDNAIKIIKELLEKR